MCRILHESDKEIHVTGASFRHSANLNYLDERFIDFNDFPNVELLVCEVNPDVIIHCAAVTDVEYCENNPSESRILNADVCKLLTSVCISDQVKIVMISTDQLWRNADPWIKEDEKPEPVNIYGQTKAAGENYISDYKNHLIIRTNFFGNGTSWKPSLSDIILKTLVNGKIFHGFEDVYFSPMFVNDLAGYIIKCVNRNLIGLYHVSGSDRLSKYEFAVKMADHFGFSNKQIKRTALKSKNFSAKRPFEMSLCTEKISRDLDIVMPGINESIKKLGKDMTSVSIIE